MLTIHPTNDVTYTVGGLVVGYDGLLWPAETAEGVPEATATLTVVIELSGTAETPTTTIPEATASLPVEITLEGTAETPTAEITSSLAISVDLAAAAETPPDEGDDIAVEVGEPFVHWSTEELFVRWSTEEPFVRWSTEEPYIT